jgi:ABC-type transport system involved in cytochrome c biogenesis permease subunit
MAPGVATFAQLPVSAGGRVKPMDTAARNLLMTAGGRQTTERGGQQISAVRFLIDLIAEPERVIDDPVVRVDHPGVLALLGRSPADGGRLPLGAIEPHWQTIIEQAERADAVEPRERDAYQQAVIDLHNRVATVLAHGQLFEPYVVPPLHPSERWRNFPQALGAASAPSAELHPGVTAMTRMMSAWSDGNLAAFEAETSTYTDLLRSASPAMMRDTRIEVLFNRASLFSGATAVYVLAVLGLLASFLMRARVDGGSLSERVRSGSVALIIAAVAVHTVAIAIRIYLQDRPPVTNLYSSAIFVGWASVLVGLVLERIYPLGVAALGSAAVGCSTLIVAHNLGADGDTMQMMQAVLDSNFWLATHVITITLGYSATFLAGALGVIYLVASTFTRWLTRDREMALSRMIYGTVCFALLLSFVGTVLGGIWADQSWGRFWGWDPKENGAALVVLLTALILHARWGGIIKRRGVAVLAVFGNIVTAWSWFGTNMLGVGLHSYGFVNSARCGSSCSSPRKC